MTGVILCGGQSTRMGADKGLLPFRAGSWAECAAGKMTAIGLPVLVSVNTEQYSSYAGIFGHTQLVKDAENLSAAGPLRGILSVHLLYPTEDLFVLACDMPLMETTILEQLTQTRLLQKADAYIFTNNGEAEPLCGIYTAGALQHITQLLQTKQLLRHSMKHLLEQANTCRIPLAAGQQKYFRNFNAQAELNNL